MKTGKIIPYKIDGKYYIMMFGREYELILGKATDGKVQKESSQKATREKIPMA